MMLPPSHDQTGSSSCGTRGGWQSSTFVFVVHHHQRSSNSFDACLRDISFVCYGLPPKPPSSGDTVWVTVRARLFLDCAKCATRY
jgi:hypothetical protein